MPRFAMRIEYDGSPFHGWQAQENAASVQAAIEGAIQKFCGERVRLFAAGRTDAGVHAKGQVAHFDLIGEQEGATITKAVNFYLKDLPISILETHARGADFHARFSALMRHYRYHLIARNSKLSLQKAYAWRVPENMDIVAMEAGARHLIGRHDFSSFRASGCQSNSPVKSIKDIRICREGEHIFVDVAAQSFLYHQIRSIVGCLKQVGVGKWESGKIKDVLEAKDRSLCATLAPAHGLYFMGVDYPLEK